MAAMLPHQTGITGYIVLVCPIQRALPIPFFQSPPGREYLHAQKFQPTPRWNQYIVFRVHLQTEAVSQKYGRSAPHRPHLFRRVGYNEEIIAIAQIGPRFYGVFYEPIELIEIDIREYLAGQVADRYASFSGCATCLVGFRCRIAIDNFEKHASRLDIDDPERQYLFQDSVVDMIEELPYIRAPDETSRMPPEVFLCPIDSPDQPLSLAARPDVEDECLVIYRVQVFVKQTMDDAVTDIGDADLAPLVVGNGEPPIRPVPIGPALKVGCETGQVPLQCIPETVQCHRPPLSAAEQEPAFPDNILTHIYGRNSHHHQDIRNV